MKILVKIKGWEPTEILSGDVDNAVWLYENPGVDPTEIEIYSNNVLEIAELAMALMLAGF